MLQDGVKVFIDKKAQLSLLGKSSHPRLPLDLCYIINALLYYCTGTEMDFVETKLSSEFVFNNPNIKGTCGCGESFSM